MGNKTEKSINFANGRNNTKLLFLRNNCVIIDFGAFVCNYAPVEIHLQENKNYCS